MKSFLISTLVFIIYKTLTWTWRLRVEEPEEMKTLLRERKTFILAHWHGDELCLMQLIGKYRVATIVSTSKDGEMMNRLVHWVGGKTSRGSSTRGGVSALKGLLRLLKSGYNTSFAVDGPKGPIYQVKPGVFEVAKLTEAPIFWAGVSCSSAYRFEKSWNKTFLPKPFSKVLIQWQGPLFIHKEDDPKSEALAENLANKLNAARQQAFDRIATL